MTIQETINRKYEENLNLTNEERAQRAEMAIAAYPGGDPEDLAATIVDLVTDLMHLAHANDIEPDYVAQTAADHYDAEVEEEAGTGPCSVCQTETTYSSGPSLAQGKHIWLCPDHGGKP